MPSRSKGGKRPEKSSRNICIRHLQTTTQKIKSDCFLFFELIGLNDTLSLHDIFVELCMFSSGKSPSVGIRCQKQED